VCFGREQKAQTRGFLKFDTGFHDSVAALYRLCCGLPGTVGCPVGGRDCGPFGAGCCGGWRSDISSAVPSPPSPVVVPPGSLSIIPVRDCIIELEVLVMRPDNPSSNLTEGRSLIICCVLQINPCNSWLAMGLRLRMSGAREEKILIRSLNSTFFPPSVGWCRDNIRRVCRILGDIHCDVGYFLVLACWLCVISVRRSNFDRNVHRTRFVTFANKFITINSIIAFVCTITPPTGRPLLQDKMLVYDKLMNTLNVMTYTPWFRTSSIFGDK